MLGPLLRLTEAQLELGTVDAALDTIDALRAKGADDTDLTASLKAARASAEGGDIPACLLLVREVAGRFDPATRAAARSLLFGAERWSSR